MTDDAAAGTAPAGPDLSGPAGARRDGVGPGPEENPMTGSTITATRPATLEMAGIAKHFGGVAALTDVSVSVLSGEVHAILGENGAGKSTLMSIASGTLVPDAGTITVGGQTVASLTPGEAAARGSSWHWRRSSWPGWRRSCGGCERSGAGAHTPPRRVQAVRPAHS